MKSVILPILLLSLPLIAGCSEPEEPSEGFTVHLHNESGHDGLYQMMYVNGELWGKWRSEPSGAGAGSTGGSCPHNSSKFEGMNPGDPFTFTLVAQFRDQSVFAEGSRETHCGDEFAAWIHPDGYIVFQDTDTRYSSPPWE